MDNFPTGLEEIKNKTNMVWMPPALSVPTRKTAKKLITEQSKGLSNMNSKWFIEKEKDPTYCLEMTQCLSFGRHTVGRNITDSTNWTGGGGSISSSITACTWLQGLLEEECSQSLQKVPGGAGTRTSQPFVSKKHSSAFGSWESCKAARRGRRPCHHHQQMWGKGFYLHYKLIKLMFVNTDYFL